MEPSTTLTSNPNYEAIKEKQRAAWSAGDYAKIGTTLQLVGEELAEAIDAVPHARVLDVAAGNGNASLAMARRFCRVTSTDYVDSLLDRARQRAIAEGLDIDFRTADAEQLPFRAGEFDAVVSTFGVMFAPNQDQCASELLRVCRSGGRIGLANWTPDSFIGNLFKTLGRHLPPPAGLGSPANWGREQWIDAHFRPAAADILIQLKSFVFRYASPKHFVGFFREFYGPVHKAFAALPPAGQKGLEADLLHLVEEFDTATDGSMRVPSEYAEIVITKQ